MGKMSNVHAVSKTSQTSISAYEFTVMSPQTNRGLLHFSLSLSLLSLTDSPHQLGLGVLKLTERRWLRPEFLRVGSVWVVWLWLFTPLGEGVFLFFKWLVDSTSFDHGSFAFTLFVLVSVAVSGQRLFSKHWFHLPFTLFSLTLFSSLPFFWLLSHLKEDNQIITQNNQNFSVFVGF